VDLSSCRRNFTVDLAGSGTTARWAWNSNGKLKTPGGKM
jgi:hypothetical protein